ncbi:hypothetical protein OG2516_07732 [Oceanicola granulosus HTCC2516]|uniref:Uncharacterized protein n=1 Tax=Oceanicola granulosus (strain ATCC BAA-861 / DSM 15982 / KCTC 12143 / HTCC2516) TaxID=314256 RepID=Q2CIA8_OCEGH|nr:hypothetical protein OG2516_07732 [Oceanicola granulosus HTCC2516]
MQAHPGRAARGVEERVQQRPVRYRVGAVLHRLGLAVGRGDGAGIEVVAADHHRRRQLAVAHHLVKGEAEPVALAEPDPADSRRQPLEGDPLARHVEPGVQVRIVDQLLHLGVGLVDVLGVARERTPAERPDAPAEQRADVGRHEAREGEGVLEPLLLGDLPDVVAVIERRHPQPPVCHHRRHVVAHRGARRRLDRRRVALLPRAPLGDGPAGGEVAVHGVVGAGLVGDDVGAHAAPDQLGHQFGGVADQRHRLRLARRGPAPDHLERLVERAGLGVDVAGAQAEVGAALVALDGEAAGAGHHRGERLGAAHAAEPGGEDPAPREVAAVMLAAGLDEGLVGALHDPLGADVDPAPRGHLAVHGEALAVELVEVLPGGPARHQVGIGDQHPGRVGVGAEDADGLAGLDQQGLVGLELAQGGADAVEILPGPRRPADAAVDDELVRVLGDVGVQVVHQHPERRLGEPALGADLGPGRREYVAQVVAGVGHRATPRLGARSARSCSMAARTGRRRAALASS